MRYGIAGLCVKLGANPFKKAKLWPFNSFQNGGRRHLGFLHYVNFGAKSDCGTPFSTYVSNSVQMRAIMAELWPKM